jgi:chorismate--pyruvate lyase
MPRSTIDTLPAFDSNGLENRPELTQYSLIKSIWRNQKTYQNKELTPQIKTWLLDSGSLTATLVKRSNNRFRVEVQQQGWLRPHAHEAKTLGLRYDQQALIRETLLICADQPWVFARSVIPASTLEGKLRHLAKLQNQSLGALLFKDPKLQRTGFELAHAPASAFQAEVIENTLPGSKSTAGAQPTPPLLWGRRSVFRLYQQPLLVAEIFLPPFMDTL